MKKFRLACVFLSLFLAFPLNTSQVFATSEITSESSLGYVQSTAPHILNIRSGAGLDYDIIGDFPNGAVAQLLGVSGGWYLIYYDGVIGYCAAEYTVAADEEDYLGVDYSTDTDEEDAEDVDEEEDAEDVDEEEAAEDVDEGEEEDSEDVNEEEAEENEDVDLEDIVGLYNSTDPCVNPSQNQYNTSSINTTITVPDGLTESVYVLLYNIDLDNYYQLELLAENAYMSDYYVPAGDYEVVEVFSDSFSFEIVNDSNFSVEDGGSHTIRAKYVDEDTVEDTDEDVETAEDAETDEETNDDESDEDTIYPWRTVSKSSDAPDISYDGLSTGSYDIVINITHSGGLGEALYEISFDGGETYEDENTVQEEIALGYYDEEGTYVDTGLVLYFSDDTYKIGSYYSFSTVKEWETSANTDTGSILYVTGVPTEDKTYNLVVEIIEAGSLGSATYKYTYDSETWSSEAILPDDGIVELKSGITFRLYGDEFEEGDTFEATIIGEAIEDTETTVDRTYLILAFLIGIVVVAFIVAVIFLNNKKTKKSDYELMR